MARERNNPITQSAEDYIDPYRTQGSGASPEDAFSIYAGYLSNNEFFSRDREANTNALNWLAQLYQNQWNKDETLRTQAYNSEASQLYRLLGLGMSKDAAFAALSGTQATPAVAGTAGTGTAQAQDPLSQALGVASSAAGLVSGTAGAVKSSLDIFKEIMTTQAYHDVMKDADEVYSWRNYGIRVPERALESYDYFKRWTDEVKPYIDESTAVKNEDGDYISFDWNEDGKEIGLTEASKKPFLFTHSPNWRKHYLSGLGAGYRREAFRTEFLSNVYPRGKVTLESESWNRREKQRIENAAGLMDNLHKETQAIIDGFAMGEMNSSGFYVLGGNYAHSEYGVPTDGNRLGYSHGSNGVITHISHTADDGALFKDVVSSLYDEKTHRVRDDAPLIFREWDNAINEAIIKASVFVNNKDVYIDYMTHNMNLQKISAECDEYIKSWQQSVSSDIDANKDPFIKHILGYQSLLKDLQYNLMQNTTDVVKDLVGDITDLIPTKAVTKFTKSIAGGKSRGDSHPSAR